MNKNITWMPAPDSVSLKTGECHLHYLQVAHIDTSAKYIQYLDFHEKKRAEQIKNPLDRARFILARTTLRQLLSQYLQLPLASIEFHYNAWGKPFVTAPLSFNVSHAGNSIVLAFTQGVVPVGVDIEYLHREHDLLKIARRYFSEAEYQALLQASSCDIKAYFYHLWTQKEAFVKAQGVGLSYGLRSFTVKNYPEAGLVCVDKDANEAGEWQMVSFAPCEDVVGALAIRAPRVVLRCYSVINGFNKLGGHRVGNSP